MSEPYEQEYTYVGNFSSGPPHYSILLSCDDCRIKWTGCAAAADCPKCGKGKNIIVDKLLAIAFL